MTVFGFVHESDSNLDDLIASTCLLYYAVNEYFPVHGSCIHHDPLQNIIVHRGGDYHNSAYGNVAIRGDTDLDDRINEYRWTLKVINRHCTGGVLIGIDSSSRQFVDDDFGFDHPNMCIQYSGYSIFRNSTVPMTFTQRSNNKDLRGRGFKNGDIVTMRVNVPRREVEFCHNGHQAMGTAADSFFDGRTYYLAITLTPHSGVQLIDFQTS